MNQSVLYVSLCVYREYVSAVFLLPASVCMCSLQMGLWDGAQHTQVLH